MIRPTVLRNSAEPEIVIGIALKIFYQAKDWIDNATFLDCLDKEYDLINKVRESRSGGQAVAKYKPALYYGLIDVSDDGKQHRINEFGERYYEAYVENNQDLMVDCLISSICNHEFGRNNAAVPESRSRIEPPKVFLVSCLLLNNKLSKTEYAYIIENLANDKDYKKILVEISLARLKGSELEISNYAKNNYKDDKGLKFLSDAGFFDEDKGIKSIKGKYLLKYSDVLSSLTIITDENQGYIPNYMKYLELKGAHLQKIYYGAPGTGKSNEIKLLTGVGNDECKFDKNFTFRTTFHPDSDYSSFVGCYKPTQKERIVNYKSWDELKQIADIISADNKDKVKAIVQFIRENAESIKKVIEEKGYDNFSRIFGSSSQESNNKNSERFGWNSYSYLGSFLDEILREREENSNGQLTYAFTPQAFTKAYVAAWTHPDKNVALIIEEINRGNCAQIFGDIFQLLDRESNGLSKYPIEADNDMQAYLYKQFANLDTIFDGELQAVIDNYYKDHYDTAFADIKSGKILALPANLSILCTMNTSDQSLFPMDSAFKRRWDWQYMPIKNGGLEWKIELSENFIKIDWWEFLKRINKVVADLTTSEDKQLGYFFCQPDSFVDSENKSDDDKHDLITAKHFVDKVIFYLWNDVFKDYAFDASCCKDENGKEVLFAQFYNEDGKSVNTDVLKRFFETLKSDNEPSLVEVITSETQDEPDVE